MRNVITITTDFGDQFAASQLRAVIATLGFKGEIIENHSVTPFAISEGAFEIKQIAKFSPHGSIHVGVVDPGVGTSRWGIVIETPRSWFVGPNNGLLYAAACEEGILNIWKIEESAFGKEVTNTFHGRDIFIKAAVYIAQGKDPIHFNCSSIGINLLEKISFAEGEIVHIDRYGNYKIHWTHKLIMGKKLILQTHKKEKVTIPIVKTFDDVSPKKPLAMLGSNGTLEIAVNLASAVKTFRFGLGAKLLIKQV